MDRRTFTGNVFRAALGGIVGTTQTLPKSPSSTVEGVPFKFSVMLWTVYKDLPIEQRLEKIAEAGYNSVEFSGQFENWSDDKIQKVIRKKHELEMGFDATGGLRRHGIADPRERQAFLADLHQMLTFADRLEIPAVIVLTGDRVPGLSHEAQHQSCIDGLKQAAELVEGRKTRLLMENIDPEENPRYYLTSVAEGLEIIQAVNHLQVRMLYDIYHEQVAEGNLIQKLERHVDLVGLVHIADVPGRHEPGTGEIDYINIFKTLAELHYSHYVAMEYLPTYDPVSSLRATREKAIRAARAVTRRQG